MEDGWKPSLADPDLWYRDAGNCYEYLCVYVDDLFLISHKPEQFFEDLRIKYGYKLKGVGEPTYHLGGDFGRDPDGTLYWGSATYIKKIMANYERRFDGLK